MNEAKITCEDVGVLDALIDGAHEVSMHSFSKEMAEELSKFAHAIEHIWSEKFKDQLYEIAMDMDTRGNDDEDAVEKLLNEIDEKFNSGDAA
jgi:hypothetical protein